MAVYGNYNRYSDNLARKRRRRFFVLIMLAIFVLFSLSAFSVYAMFYSPWLRMNDIEIKGLKTAGSEELVAIIEALRNEPYPYLSKIGLWPGKNILFFDTEILERKILAELSVMEKVTAAKEIPHKLKIEVVERTPTGTWCFGESGEFKDCRYFDWSGIVWGKALRSSGSLLLNIDDKRESQDFDNVKKPLIEAVQKLNHGLNEIGIKIKYMEIPDKGIGDIRVYIVAGYQLLFNIDSDISGQLEVLKILLREKGHNFAPEYIDLRIDGRAYHK